MSLSSESSVSNAQYPKLSIQSSELSIQSSAQYPIEDFLEIALV